MTVDEHDEMDVLPFVLASICDRYDFDTAFSSLLGCALARYGDENNTRIYSEQIAGVQRWLMAQRHRIGEAHTVEDEETAQ